MSLSFPDYYAVYARIMHYDGTMSFHAVESYIRKHDAIFFAKEAKPLFRINPHSSEPKFKTNTQVLLSEGGVFRVKNPQRYQKYT